MKRRINCILLLLIFVSLLVCGCKQGPPMGKVTGTVTYNGEPVKTGVITFEIEGARQGRAEIEDGKIVKASTYDSNDGISVGNAKISVTSYTSTKREAPAGGAIPNSNRPSTGVDVSMLAPPVITSHLPNRYANPFTSGLTAVIQKGNNVINLELSDK